MFVARLTLARFRSHALTRLEADGRPVAVIGPNGAGKTNLLEALSLLSPGRGLRRADPDALGRREGAVPGAEPPGPWKIAAEWRGADTREVETGAEGGPRWVRIDGKAAPQARLGELAAMVWLTPAMDRLWIEGAAERRRFLDRLAFGFFPGHAEAASGYEKGLRERNRLLREGRADARWLAALEGRMAEAGAALTRGRAATVARLAAAQAGASDAFPEAALTLAPGAEADEAEAGALAEFWARGRARDLAAGRTLAGPHRADLGAMHPAKGMAARDCSTGEQKALLIRLILSAARALAEDRGAPPVLLLDEVAAHLDAERRAALFDAICDLGAQAWMTGAEPGLFEALGERGALLRVTEGPDGSTVT